MSFLLRLPIESKSRKYLEAFPSLLIKYSFPDKDISVKDVEQMGYRIALFPLVTLIGTIGVALRCARRYLKKEDSITRGFL